MLSLSPLSPQKSRKSKHQSWLNFITATSHLQPPSIDTLSYTTPPISQPHPPHHTPPLLSPPCNHHSFSYVQRTNNFSLFPITPCLLCPPPSSSSSSFVSPLFSLLPPLFTILTIILCILIVGVSQIQLIYSMLHGFPTGTSPAA